VVFSVHVEEKEAAQESLAQYLQPLVHIVRMKLVIFQTRYINLKYFITTNTLKRGPCFFDQLESRRESHRAPMEHCGCAEVADFLSTKFEYINGGIKYLTCIDDDSRCRKSLGSTRLTFHLPKVNPGPLVRTCGRSFSLMGGFLFENAATRASLKSAFDHLFCKYGREFEDDDEIDLSDLSIIKRGGHVGSEKARGFGSCYKKSRHMVLMESQQQDYSSHPELEDEEQEDTYDDVFKRLSGKVKDAQMRTRAEPLTFSPLPPFRPFRPPEHKTIANGSPRAKMNSSLRRLALEDSTEEYTEDEIETSEVDSQPESEEKLQFVPVARSNSFDDHLLAFINADDQKLLSHACRCAMHDCFNCHLISICLQK